MRENKNEHIVDYSNTIKKSNDVSMAKLNQNLTLNQIQLLAYAIFSTQQNGETYFRKYEFQEKFGIKHYKTEDAYADSEVILDLKFSTQDLENNKFSFTNVFSHIDYQNGLFTFEWNKRMIAHILEIKESYVLTDLTVTSNFKSSYSWILYEYLKAHYGYWNMDMSKDSLMKLFAVEDVASYKRSTGHFKSRVLDKAINEINNFTELQVWYEENKVGKKITGFKLKWSVGKRKYIATDKQFTYLREIQDEVNRKMIDYISINNTDNYEKVRSNLMEMRKINEEINGKLTIDRAKELIDDSKRCYKTLENLLEIDQKGRDTSVYFDWLNESDE